MTDPLRDFSKVAAGVYVINFRDGSQTSLEAKNVSSGAKDYIFTDGDSDFALFPRSFVAYVMRLGDVDVAAPAKYLSNAAPVAEPEPKKKRSHKRKSAAASTAESEPLVALDTAPPPATAVG